MKKQIIILLSGISLFADTYYWGSGVAPVSNTLYTSECASCHFAYQPGLLPEKSWVSLMNGLENHFGTDASLDSESKKSILEYLIANSAEKAMEYKRSRKIVESIPFDETPIAITKTGYFVRKHREIPQKMITQSEVKSLSNCTACHTSANKGIYSERAIFIPNFGRWDDD